MNFVMLPMWILSGSFFSYERFPEWLRLPIRLPLTAVNDALRAVMLGQGQRPGRRIAGPLAVLATWALVSFAAALRIFRWQ